ncbi:hypothetical protein CR513_24768, partial [Mucuna pruriens]
MEFYGVLPKEGQHPKRGYPKKRLCLKGGMDNGVNSSNANESKQESCNREGRGNIWDTLTEKRRFLGSQVSFLLSLLSLLLGSNSGKLHAYDLEIDRTFHWLRSHRSSEVANNSHNDIDFDYNPSNSDFDLGVYISKFSLDNMTDNYKTLKELTTPNIMCQPGVFDILNWNKFSEDHHKHLKEFHDERNLISNMAVNEVVVVGNQRLENKITKLISLVIQLAIGQHHISPLVRVCDICASIEYPTNMCPILEYVGHKSEFANTDWIIDHHYESTIVQRLIESSICIEISSAINVGAEVVDIASANIARVLEVVEVQTPLSSVVQPLQPSELLVSSYVQRKRTTDNKIEQEILVSSYVQRKKHNR